MNIHVSNRVKIARSLAVIAGTGALIIGATMSASVGTASLTGNTFSASTTATGTGVLIAADNSGTPGTFSNTLTGFNFGTLTPGSTASPSPTVSLSPSPTSSPSNASARSHFWLKNNSGSAITLTLAASSITGFANLDQTMAIVHIEKTGTTTDDSNSLASLGSTSATISNPPATTDTNGIEYDVWVTLDNGALTNSATTTTGSFDLNFTGSTQ